MNRKEFIDKAISLGYTADYCTLVDKEISDLRVNYGMIRTYDDVILTDVRGLESEDIFAPMSVVRFKAAADSKKVVPQEYRYRVEPAFGFVYRKSPTGIAEIYNYRLKDWQRDADAFDAFYDSTDSRAATYDEAMAVIAKFSSLTR